MHVGTLCHFASAIESVWRRRWGVVSRSLRRCGRRRLPPGRAGQPWPSQHTVLTKACQTLSLAEPKRPPVGRPGSSLPSQSRLAGMQRSGRKRQCRPSTGAYKVYLHVKKPDLVIAKVCFFFFVLICPCVRGRLSPSFHSADVIGF